MYTLPRVCRGTASVSAATLLPAVALEEGQDEVGQRAPFVDILFTSVMCAKRTYNHQCVKEDLYLSVPRETHC